MRKTKIHFSNVDFSSRTGPNSFGRRLAHELTLRGTYEIVSDEKQACDITLVFIETFKYPYGWDPKFPLNRRKERCKIIHRLDGIWFKNEKEFIENNQSIRAVYQIADHVIWQSEFDKNMTIHHWGAPNKGTIIRNGIEISQKKPKNPIANSPPFCISSANWHGQKRPQQTVELFEKIQKINPGMHLVILGDPPVEWKKYQVSTDNEKKKISEEHQQKTGGSQIFWLDNHFVHFLNSRDHEECLSYYAAAEWMIHIGWNDHCPNVCIEAISQGCPVICASSGGTKEIVGTNGIVIPESNGPWGIEYDYRLYDYDNPPKLDFSTFELPNRLKVDPNSVDIKKVTDRYIQVFDEVLNER